MLMSSYHPSFNNLLALRMTSDELNHLYASFDSLNSFGTHLIRYNLGPLTQASAHLILTFSI